MDVSLGSNVYVQHGKWPEDRPLDFVLVFGRGRLLGDGRRLVLRCQTKSNRRSILSKRYRPKLIEATKQQYHH